MTAFDHTQQRNVFPWTVNDTPHAFSVHRSTTQSTFAGCAPNRTHARACGGFGAIVTGSFARSSSSGVRDCSGPAVATHRARICSSRSRSITCA